MPGIKICLHGRNTQLHDHQDKWALIVNHLCSSSYGRLRVYFYMHETTTRFWDLKVAPNVRLLWKKLKTLRIAYLSIGNFPHMVMRILTLQNPKNITNSQHAIIQDSLAMSWPKCGMDYNEFQDQKQRRQLILGSLPWTICESWSDPSGLQLCWNVKYDWYHGRQHEERV